MSRRPTPPRGSRLAVPLLAGIAHYALVGTLTSSERHVLVPLLGDAIVRVPSACGRCGDAGRDLGFPLEHVKVFPGVHHRGLAHDRKVYRQIRTWCAGESS